MKRFETILKKSAVFVILLSAGINVAAQCDTTKYGETFKNGSYVKGFLACDKREGEWKYYDKQGKLLKVSHYSKGQLHGEQSTWYPNGQQKSIENYNNGLLDGSFQSWTEEGQMLEDFHYLNGQ